VAPPPQLRHGRQHGAAAPSLQQPRLPDHLHFGGASGAAHADELTFNSTIKGRAAGGKGLGSWTPS